MRDSLNNSTDSLNNSGRKGRNIRHDSLNKSPPQLIIKILTSVVEESKRLSVYKKSYSHD